MPLKRFVVRLTISFVLVAGMLILPLFLIIEANMDEANRNGAIITVAILNAMLISAIIIWHYHTIISPIKKINDVAHKIADGQYENRIDQKFYDYDINNVSKNFNLMAEEFQNLEQMRKSFVANASHELRSPLTSMQGFLQAILDGTISESDYKKYINIVLSETKRLSFLINSMLDLSRLESGNAPLNLQCFELCELIRRVVIRFEPSLIKKGITMGVDFAMEKMFVYADREKIEQVIINLVDNAIKYSPQNSRISVSTHLHQRKAYVSVKDCGYGIDKKDQGLIWERFHMVDKARTPGKERGTGLGLSIVKKIIEDHKEVIWVESMKGQGSTFIFTLPMFDSTKHRAKPNGQNQ